MCYRIVSIFIFNVVSDPEMTKDSQLLLVRNDVFITCLL